jgi:acetyl esterase/lipase
MSIAMITVMSMVFCASGSLEDLLKDIKKRRSESPRSPSAPKSPAPQKEPAKEKRTGRGIKTEVSAKHKRYNQLSGPAVNYAGKKATFADVEYGSHQRNVLDIWIAPVDEPTPLVIYIHGGDFRVGDKSENFKNKDVVRFLKEGISVAMINYRYLDEAPNGVLGCLQDTARAIQFLRSKAKVWNLDPNRFGAIGNTAGAGAALWLATVDDLAKPESDDPVSRQSSRLAAVGLTEVASTYNFERWARILGIHLKEVLVESGYEQQFYGQQVQTSRNHTMMKRIRTVVDSLALVSQDDPPMWISNTFSAALPENEDSRFYHPNHALALHQRAKNMGIDARVYADAIDLKPKSYNDIAMSDFMLEQLKDD